MSRLDQSPGVALVRYGPRRAHRRYHRHRLDSGGRGHGRALSAPLRDCHGRLVVAIDTHIEAREVGPEKAGLSHRDLRPIRETVFGGGADRTDPFSVAVSAAVRAIEDAMVPHLGRARPRTGPTTPG